MTIDKCPNQLVGVDRLEWYRVNHNLSTDRLLDLGRITESSPRLRWLGLTSKS